MQQVAARAVRYVGWGWVWVDVVAEDPEEHGVVGCHHDACRTIVDDAGVEAAVRVFQKNFALSGQGGAVESQQVRVASAWVGRGVVNGNVERSTVIAESRGRTQRRPGNVGVPGS